MRVSIVCALQGVDNSVVMVADASPSQGEQVKDGYFDFRGQNQAGFSYMLGRGGWDHMLAAPLCGIILCEGRNIVGWNVAR